MRIGGFVKQSFIDWEGMLSAVVFTKGCNMRCGYCHNPSLVVPDLMEARRDIPVEGVLDYLAMRRGWLDAVVVSGGEPTLQRDLPDFIRKIKEMGYKVKLDTNGTDPDMLEQLALGGMIDFVAMDIKHIPDLASYKRITTMPEDMMESVRRSIRFLLTGSVPCQFRTTVIGDVHTPEVCAALGKMFAGTRYVTQYFRRTGKDGIVGDYM